MKRLLFVLSVFIQLTTFWLALPVTADILIVSPENPHALELANKIKDQITGEKIVVSSNPNLVPSPELIITVGTSTLKGLRSDLNAPTIAAFVSPHDFEFLDKTIAVPTAPVYSTADPNQVVEFLQDNFPGSRIGYVYEDEKDPYLISMELAAHELGVNIVPIELQGNIFKTYRRVFRKKAIDIMLITNSSHIYTVKNIRFVLESLYREKIPAIGLTKQIVKAGAVAAIYADEKDIVASTVDQIKTYVAFRNFSGETYVMNHNVISHKKLAEEFEVQIQGAQYYE